MTRHNNTGDDGSKVVNDTNTSTTRRGALRIGAGLAVTAVGGASVAGTAAAQSALDGSGTESDPYVVRTYADLDAVRDDVSAHYELTGDIDATGTDWTPIAEFGGTLDGAGHTVSGLTVNADGRTGLIQTLRGTVTGLKITDASIAGGEQTGVVAGYSEGVIEDVYASGTVDTGDSDHVGGIVGEALSGAVVRRVNADVTVTGTSAAWNVGGVVGKDNGGTITRVTATGDVTAGEFVGGVLGRDQGGTTLTDVAARGSVTSLASGEVQTGGVIGIINSDAGRFERVYAAGTVDGTDYATGGVVGEAVFNTPGDAYWDTDATGQSEGLGMSTDDDRVTGLTTSEMQGDNALNYMDTFDYSSVWTVADGEYPRLASAPNAPETSDDEVLAGGATSSGDGTSARYVPWGLAVIAAALGVSRASEGGGE